MEAEEEVLIFALLGVLDFLTPESLTASALGVDVLEPFLVGLAAFFLLDLVL